jgi:glycerol-3-phosphate dehydrogenase
MATGIRSVDAVRKGTVGGKWALQRAFQKAQFALGDRMYRAGLDDGRTGALLAGVDRELRRGGLTPATVQNLNARRKQLLLQLAAAALEEEAPLPGADFEYRRAREAQAALQDFFAHRTGTFTASRGEPVAAHS